MSKIKEIIQELSPNQKEIILKANEPKSIILFNIKGMIQVLHDKEPFDFIEMGYEDIKALKNKGLIDTLRGKEEGHVLQGEEYCLSKLGKELAKQLAKR